MTQHISDTADRTESQTQEALDWTDLGREMWSFLTGREAAINYRFIDMEVEIPRDTGPELARFREALAEALVSGDQQAQDGRTLQDLAVEAIARFGAMPGRGPGLSSWSAYTSLQRVSPAELMDRLVQGLLSAGLDDEQAQRAAGRRGA